MSIPSAGVAREYGHGDTWPTQKGNPPYTSRRLPDGTWTQDYHCGHILVPGTIITCAVTVTPGSRCDYHEAERLTALRREREDREAVERAEKRAKRQAKARAETIGELGQQWMDEFAQHPDVRAALRTPCNSYLADYSAKCDAQPGEYCVEANRLTIHTWRVDRAKTQRVTS